MYKYKDFLLFFCAIAVLLLWFLFPISFDNNDDQTMYAICSGMISGIPSSNIILTNIFIGELLSAAFSVSKKINWYTLYLQAALLFSYIYVCRFFTGKMKISLPVSFLAVLIVFLGFFSLSVVKLQFTTVALFCCFSALLCLQSDEKPVFRMSITIFFVALAILIRKDAFFLFFLFSLPLFLIRKKEAPFIPVLFISLLFALVFYGASVYVNNTNEEYQKYQTYPNVHALDIIAASPVKTNEYNLNENNFSLNDISLLQSWLVADDAYLSGEKMEQLAKGMEANRGFTESVTEVKKFISDERYLLVLYVLTVITVVVYARSALNLLAANILVFSALMLFLIITSRIPHRVTFPILTYLILLNIGWFLDAECKPSVRVAVLSFFLLLSTYKFYCTAKLISTHQANHVFFDACQKEVNAHPEILFIAADGFPLQYMDAWQTPTKAFPAHNLILGGWYACSPDYQTILKQKGLKNLTSDTVSKDKVLFLTDSPALQHAYIQVMRERYHIDCHFEEEADGFQVLKPKRLVFDN